MTQFLKDSRALWQLTGTIRFQKTGHKIKETFSTTLNLRLLCKSSQLDKLKKNSNWRILRISKLLILKTSLRSYLAKNSLNQSIMLKSKWKSLIIFQNKALKNQNKIILLVLIISFNKTMKALKNFTNYIETVCQGILKMKRRRTLKI